ncbi:putative gpi-anchored cell surface glycoprotein [Erysiphe necator]|uniref:Putative gpi-anchored cell surface glycoprotein n=1 Tax=Uncinula necator TaxID=52586 RepID=A0A0B1PCR8_UNCNE|nr:putative gpi-anchored cell surface glycoprotein [Erysiphe necator]
MSLNGLGDPNIKEAREKAVSEPGGWFLLKYASRDKVDLLARGDSGTVEMQETIARYEDSSPLFGFLRFRRKSVLIKYVPGGCSRLVQARVTVHFNAISDHFPHDLTFSITSSHELRDTALSAACSFHSTSGSTSSSTSSLQRRQLMEITEEEEEETRVNRKSVASDISEGEFCVAKVISISESSISPSSKDRTSLSGRQQWDAHTTRSSISLLSSDFQPDISTHRTSSDYTERLSESFIYPPFTSSSRSKIRLGPRPSHDDRRSFASRSSSYRPISALPAGLKSFAKWNNYEKEVIRPTSDSGNQTIVMNSPPSSPSSSMLMADIMIRQNSGNEQPNSSNERPTSSSELSFRSIPSPTLSVASTKNSTIDSARARLLKAQEMWKKKMEAADALHSSSIKVDTIIPDMRCDMVLY